MDRYFRDVAQDQAENTEAHHAANLVEREVQFLVGRIKTEPALQLEVVEDMCCEPSPAFLLALRDVYQGRDDLDAARRLRDLVGLYARRFAELSVGEFE